jgi:hypothetical protein
MAQYSTLKGEHLLAFILMPAWFSNFCVISVIIYSQSVRKHFVPTPPAELELVNLLSYPNLKLDIIKHTQENSINFWISFLNHLPGPNVTFDI